MIVVSNTSPIMNLAVVGQRELLARLFQTVFVPDAVWQELAAIGADSRAPSVVGEPSVFPLGDELGNSGAEVKRLELGEVLKMGETAVGDSGAR